MCDQPDYREQLACLIPYFPPHLISATAVATHAQLVGIPQILDSTLLVADLKNFSAQSAQLFESEHQDDAALLGLVNDYFSVVLAEACRFGGSPCSFDGDALSILFYGPHHSDIATEAAFAIQKSVAHTLTHLPSGNVTLQASLGLSSGQLFTGSFGQKDRLVHISLGQAATQAVGAQKLAKGPQIVVTESTLVSLSSKVASQQISPGFYTIDDIIVSEDHPRPVALPSIPPVIQNTELLVKMVTFLTSHFPSRVARGYYPKNLYQ